MESRIIKVMEEPWDYLIILDACRYDYFSRIYQNYFCGELTKGLSVGSSTPEWCMKTFPNHYADIIYISGNPMINSKMQVKGCDARDHFFKIVDVWDFGWSKEFSTVHPDTMNNTTLNYLKKFPTKRFIIHYLQPHEPYLSKKFSVEDMLQTSQYKNGQQWLHGYQIRQQTRFEQILRKIPLRNGRIRKIRQVFHLPPTSAMEAVRRKYGIDGLRQAYKENLRLCLVYVAKLCEQILQFDVSKRVVISSDHGEYLGEQGNYSHKRGSNDPILLDVPFFKVHRVNFTKPLQNERDTRVDHSPVHSELGDQEKIKERLRKLGYI